MNFFNLNCRNFIYTLIIIVAISCADRSIEDPEEVILVSINDSITISKNEFIRRAEYTIRPPYCKKSTYLDKKIVLNSLIAEKLFALEAGTTNGLLENDGFKRFIKGRREQAMRQWMYHKEATENVHLDSAEIEKYYQYSGREYEVSYYTIHDTAKLNQAMKRSKDHNRFFENFHHETYGGGSIPKRKIAWTEQEDFSVLKSFFTERINSGDVIFPIQINQRFPVIYKVLGWTDTKIYTENQIRERWKKVSERLKYEQAGRIWEKLAAQIMQGKTLDFDKSVFWAVSNIFSKYYVKSEDQLKEELQSGMWNEGNVNSNKISYDLEQISSEIFFNIDEITWTVNDFRKELLSHPLVFRKRNMSSEEFPQQFRLAVADMIRDLYITQVAYNMEYNKLKSVKREEHTWRHAFLAIYQRDKYLDSIAERENFGKNYLGVLNTRLNTYFDSLLFKYDDQIELNVDEFEKINLTEIDLYVQQLGIHYQQAVPRFPVLTSNHSLGYVTELND
ncbi:MAG: hypothetical protein ACXAC2_14275 [Candidatus Kariarchaeaceae archaeon]|jgi:hypothetical protein